MKKQTAVEWFFENLNSHKIQLTANELFEQAKQMEKEQIMEAWREGLYHHYDGEFLPKRKYKDYEDYYNKVYNQP
jgi:hypothetical protein